MQAPTTTQPATTTSQPKPRIRRIGEGRYLIESRSRPGIGRQVDLLRDRCSCPAGRHGRACWHKRWAHEYEECRHRYVDAAARAWLKEDLERRIAADMHMGPLDLSNLAQQQPAPPAPSMPASQQTTEPVALSSFFE